MRGGDGDGAHPLENPTPLTNIIEIVLMLLPALSLGPLAEGLH